jgi:hypothetical protein
MTQSPGGARTSPSVPAQPGAPAAESAAAAPTGASAVSGAGSSKADSLAALSKPWTPEHATSTRWQGWAFFGGAAMILLGLFQGLFGLIALVDKQYFTVRTNSLLVVSSYSGWGWIHLIGGVLAVAAGLGIVLGGHTWARVLGVVVAVLSALANVGFLRASPVWSLLLITLDVLVIFALTVHGAEIDDR